MLKLWANLSCSFLIFNLPLSTAYSAFYVCWLLTNRWRVVRCEQGDVNSVRNLILWLVELLQNSLFGINILPRAHVRTKTKQCGRFKIALWIKMNCHRHSNIEVNACIHAERVIISYSDFVRKLYSFRTNISNHSNIPLHVIRRTNFICTLRI